MSKKLVPYFLVATCLALAACGNVSGQGVAVDSEGEPDITSVVAPTVDRDSYSNIHAVLNPEKQTIDTPLNKYVHDADERMTIARANYINLKKCATGKGYELPHHFYQTEYRIEAPFGVWSNSFAEKYGYEINHTLGKVYVDEGYRGEDVPSEIQQTFETCLTEIADQEIPYFIKGVAMSATAETAVLSEVSGQVTYLVQEDSDVKAAIQEWIQCLNDQGIQIDPQYEEPFPIIPDDKEANIKQALVDVQCKKDVRLMERYYDAQAQYEQALIEKNQAAFNTLAERKEAYLNQAKEVLQQNGITP
ncbi:hypothetical protein [Rothia nasimurium]|uniref:hypothetical protein n=1 Tax=Rothia nasimurium TaxID=85336 RepID=UPI001F24FAF9|nr:hypothetical protein [Rothia nasimurium]